MAQKRGGCAPTAGYPWLQAATSRGADSYLSLFRLTDRYLPCGNWNGPPPTSPLPCHDAWSSSDVGDSEALSHRRSPPRASTLPARSVATTHRRRPVPPTPCCCASLTPRSATPPRSTPA